MANPERVLLDTSALYALISSTDEFHADAEKAYRGLVAAETDLWITSYILVEFGALVHHRLGFDALSTFVESTRDVFETLWVDASLHSDAWATFSSRKGAGLNFVDWSTFIAAERIGAAIFTFDTAFVREGADVVPAVA